MLVAGIIAVVIIAAGFIRLGFSFRYTPEKTRLILKIGWFRLGVLPQKKQKEKTKKKAEKEKPKKKQKKEKGFSKYFEGFKDIVPLWNSVKGLMRKTARGVRIDRLEANVLLGGRDDPAKTAVHYGYLMGAIGMILPVMDEKLRIKRFNIRIEPDFEREEFSGIFRLDASISIGRGMGLGFYLLRMIFKLMLGMRRRKTGNDAGSPEQKSEKAA